MVNPFLTRVRRFVLLTTAAVWQGGFVFYAGVVVPAGTELHGHFGQGLVTQRVTNTLNVFGLLCHAAYLWELIGSRERRKWKWALWAVSLAMLGGLVAIHARMDALIDATGGSVADGFRRWHIAYLWLSTSQWLIAAVLGWHMMGEPRHDCRG